MDEILTERQNGQHLREYHVQRKGRGSAYVTWISEPNLGNAKGAYLPTVMLNVPRTIVYDIAPRQLSIAFK
jgi:hypothetical protein